MYLLVDTYPELMLVLMASLGACLGSFAALIIDRVPRGVSIVSPGSSCNSCEHKLKIWHNIPIISWLILRGRCCFCGYYYGARTLFLELFFALCLSALYAQLGMQIVLLDKFLFVFILICLAYIDLDSFYLPLNLLISLFLVGMASLLFYNFYPDYYIAPTARWSVLDIMTMFRPEYFALSDRLWGAVLGYVSLALVNLFASPILRRSGRLNSGQWAMGWGDPLLVSALGLFVGASQLIAVIFLASFMGSVLGLLQLWFKPKLRDRAVACESQALARAQPLNNDIATAPSNNDLAAGAIPFGPFLALAAIYLYLF